MVIGLFILQNNKFTDFPIFFFDKRGNTAKHLCHITSIFIPIDTQKKYLATDKVCPQKVFHLITMLAVVTIK